MTASQTATASLKVIAALKADMASNTIPVSAKSLSELDSEKYLAGVADPAAVTRFVNVWLGARK